jgi:peptidoglycan-associated lipoprotein
MLNHSPTFFQGLCMRNYMAPTLALALSSSLAACATKGYVREQVGALRTQTETDIAAERTARMAGDSALQGDVAALHADVAAIHSSLDSLRTEYGMKITALENGLSFALPVHFAFNDANVRDTDKEALDRFASVAKKYYTASNITVEGFTDPAGTAEYNRQLSVRRAQSVESYLTGQGLPASTLHAVGYGETRLVEPTAKKDDPGAELNRRVVFVIESGPKTLASNDQATN